mgnify:CR=1 FL=1
MRKLVYYVAVTIDGFIAGPDGEFDFFPIEPDLTGVMLAELPETVPAPMREQVGVAGTPNGRFDAVVMGRGTYVPALEQGITSPYGHLKQYVHSRTLTTRDPEVEIVSTDPVAHVRDLKRREGGDIWLCGGGDLAAQLVGEIDELVLKRNPIVAGDGIRLFGGRFEAHRFTLTETRPFDSGVVVMRYTKR